MEESLRMADKLIEFREMLEWKTRELLRITEHCLIIGRLARIMPTIDFQAIKVGKDCHSVFRTRLERVFSVRPTTSPPSAPNKPTNTALGAVLRARRATRKRLGTTQELVWPAP
jgi:hypothetical protein